MTRNPHIEAIQRALIDAGYPLPRFGADGEWGKEGEGALRAALADAQAAKRAKMPADQLDDNDRILAAELLRDEGLVKHAYQDSLGWWTIGIGRLIDRRKGGGISEEEALYLKRNDIAAKKADLDKRLPWWRSVSPVRQRALQNLTFNMGIGWADKFKNTVVAMERGDWEVAARGIETSAYAKQVGDRAKRIAAQLRNG